MSEESKDTEALTSSKRKVFFGLFVFPMLIAVTMAILLSGVVLLTHEEDTPESLITAIKTGAPSKRWQKAFELSNELNREGGMLRSAGIMNEVIHILNDKEHYDAKTRAYMAMALSRFQDPEAELALRKALDETSEDEDPKFVLFLMWAVGNFRNPESSSSVARFLTSQHDDLRKTAAYILGAIYDTRYGRDMSRNVPGTVVVVNQLKRALEDSVVDVRWNAALSLARLGNDSGAEILLQMLDRNQLRETQQLNELEIERVMVNAAKGLGLIKRSEAQPILESISKNDPSLKVREAALNAIADNEDQNEHD